MNKALGKIVIIFGLVGVITFGWFRWDRSTKVTPEQVQEKKLLVVNVLGKEQYDDCHIKGSINMLFDEYDAYAKKLNKDTELVFYCSNYACTGSGYAAKSFKDKGFKKVWAYEAGMAEWYKQKLPVVGACKATYLDKKNTPIDEVDSEISVITTKELQEKLGF